MRYMLLIYAEDPGTVNWDDPATQAEMDAYYKFTAEVEAAGVVRGSEALQPAATATSVRVRDGEVLTTDGPFAETKEVLGGYYTVECDDLDQAIAWAARIPGAQHGTVEVRPIMEIPQR